EIESSRQHSGKRILNSCVSQTRPRQMYHAYKPCAARTRVLTAFCLVQILPRTERQCHELKKRFDGVKYTDSAAQSSHFIPSSAQSELRACLNRRKRCG